MLECGGTGQDDGSWDVSKLLGSDRSREFLPSESDIAGITVGVYVRDSETRDTKPYVTD